MNTAGVRYSERVEASSTHWHNVAQREVKSMYISIDNLLSIHSATIGPCCWDQGKGDQKNKRKPFSTSGPCVDTALEHDQK